MSSMVEWDMTYAGNLGIYIRLMWWRVLEFDQKRQRIQLKVLYASIWMWHLESRVLFLPFGPAVPKNMFQSLGRLLTNNCRHIGRRAPSQAYAILSTRSSNRLLRPLLWGGTVSVSVAVLLGFSAPTVHLDAGVKLTGETEESEGKVGQYAYCLEGQASS